MLRDVKLDNLQACLKFMLLWGLARLLYLVVQRRSGTRKLLRKMNFYGDLSLGAETVHVMGQMYNFNCFSIKLDQSCHLIDSTQWNNTCYFYSTLYNI